MTGERDQIIEAGAKASYEAYRERRSDLKLNRPWEDVGPNMRRSQLREAEIHYDAMVPPIRRQMAEELAVVVETTAFSISQVFNRSPKDYLDEAARRVREMGARPHDQEGPRP